MNAEAGAASEVVSSLHRQGRPVWPSQLEPPQWNFATNAVTDSGTQRASCRPSTGSKRGIVSFRFVAHLLTSAHLGCDRSFASCGPSYPHSAQRKQVASPIVLLPSEREPLSHRSATAAAAARAATHAGPLARYQRNGGSTTRGTRGIANPTTAAAATATGVYAINATTTAASRADAHRRFVTSLHSHCRYHSHRYSCSIRAHTVSCLRGCTAGQLAPACR